MKTKKAIKILIDFTKKIKKNKTVFIMRFYLLRVFIRFVGQFEIRLKHSCVV